MQTKKFWQKQKRMSKEDYMNILENFSVLFAYNSGAIENDKITLEDLDDVDFDKEEAKAIVSKIIERLF